MRGKCIFFSSVFNRYSKIFYNRDRCEYFGGDEMAQFKYIQLAEKLRKAIKDGVWLPDERLPSIRQLAQQYQLSKISVSTCFAVFGSTR